MQISDENIGIFLRALHEIVYVSAREVVRDFDKESDAPSPDEMEGPGSRQKLTAEEWEMLHTAFQNPTFKGAICKLMEASSDAALFHALNIIDGTGDPVEGWKDSHGIMLVNRDSLEHEEFLHDRYYDEWWTWKRLRS